MSMNTPLQRFGWAMLRGVLGAILGAFFSGLIVGLLLLPFPELQGGRRQLSILFIFIGAVSGLIAAGAGSALASVKVGLGCGALSGVIVSSLIFKHFPNEPEVMTICAISIIVPASLGALAGWIVKKWMSTMTDETADS